MKYIAPAYQSMEWLCLGHGMKLQILCVFLRCRQDCRLLGTFILLLMGRISKCRSMSQLGCTHPSLLHLAPVKAWCEPTDQMLEAPLAKEARPNLQGSFEHTCGCVCLVYDLRSWWQQGCQQSPSFFSWNALSYTIQNRFNILVRTYAAPAPPAWWLKPHCFALLEVWPKRRLPSNTKL